MKTALPALMAVFMIFLRCSVETDMAMDSPMHPPLPRTSSIIPLQAGNHWIYSYTDYDSTGKIQHSRWELDLAIPSVWGLNNKTVLETLTLQNVDDPAYEYVYEYEWEAIDSGFYVVYRDINVTVRGLYITGEYNYSTNRIQLYDTAHLWLAYPAHTGDTWTLHPEITSDSEEVTLEILSTSETFYCGNQHPLDASALSFYTCYLYKETTDSTTSYYYYNEKVGALGYLHYHNGVLRTSYMLQDFIEPSS
ncbi:MAG: hypothetical protein GF401_04460 [Chitinivibrionales bacterium]|nr:hypothetical protein [Chitinivibrionales bacterium]